MKIFRITTNDYMGFGGDESFYLQRRDAIKDMDKRIETEKKKKSFASDTDCIENGYSKNGKVINTDKGRYCNLCHWVHYNNESMNEWAIHQSTICLQEVEVNDG